MDTISQPTGDDLPTVLSQRQTECLRLAGHGYTSKEIARSIGISPSTVDNHIGAAIDRLGARNRLEAVRFMLGRSSPDAFETALIKAPAEPPVASARLAALFELPPLGGSRNAIGRSQRLLHIFQIAAIATAVSSGVILTIAGVIYVLARV